MVLYSREWYARHASLYGGQFPFDRESWVPYSWQVLRESLAK